MELWFLLDGESATADDFRCDDIGKSQEGAENSANDL